MVLTTRSTWSRGASVAVTHVEVVGFGGSGCGESELVGGVVLDDCQVGHEAVNRPGIGRCRGLPGLVVEIGQQPSQSLNLAAEDLVNRSLCHPAELFVSG